MFFVPDQAEENSNSVEHFHLPLSFLLPAKVKAYKYLGKLQSISHRYCSCFLCIDPTHIRHRPFFLSSINQPPIDPVNTSSTLLISSASRRKELWISTTLNTQSFGHIQYYKKKSFFSSSLLPPIFLGRCPLLISFEPKYSKIILYPSEPSLHRDQFVDRLIPPLKKFFGSTSKKDTLQPNTHSFVDYQARFPQRYPLTSQRSITLLYNTKIASMDAGGLAQMSYNFPSSNGLGLPGSGFASRGKGMNIKRLSFDTNAPSKPVDNGAPTPRTSRSHLLAGLRTAPKSATAASFPPSAPATQVQHPRTGLENSIYADHKVNHGGAKTSTASSFSAAHQAGFSGLGDENPQMYSMPEQVLAPPEIHLDELGQEQMDPNLYNQLVATNAYLAEQQQRLQQQLVNVQTAFKNMNLGNQMGQQYMQQQIATPPFTPNMYQQQTSVQPIVTPVVGQPGYYAVYNPMTGQQAYFMDPNAQNQFAETQQSATGYYNDSPPQQFGTPRVQVSPPPPSNATPAFTRSASPPKKTGTPPQDVSPLPPPSANAFRRGHKKSGSTANSASANGLVVNEGVRSVAPKSAGFPSTPLTGTFGPGQNRAGEHPIRQPRGPPPLDELISKPTTKHEGSKNFATRLRRDAVKNLSRSFLERRRGPGSASVGSMTPVSEAGEVTFSMSSDNDSDSGRSGSGSLSGRPTSGSSRNSFHGAIGSDRPSSRQKLRERSSERMSVNSHYTTASISSDDEVANGGTFAAVFKNGGKKPENNKENEPRKAPMLVLTSAAEKRKSSVY